ncbi:hypothetical protein BTVI_107551 [Pitangus sulphuratus]|nr:hypothetical protein BTVI_107551 [Pitangus sulphuratus]
MGDFNLPEILEHHSTGTTRTRRLLKNLDDNFMEQVLRELTWKDALLDLLLVNRVDLMMEVEIGGCLGHSDHGAISLKSLLTGGKVPAIPQLWMVRYRAYLSHIFSKRSQNYPPTDYCRYLSNILLNGWPISFALQLMSYDNFFNHNPKLTGQ